MPPTYVEGSPVGRAGLVGHPRRSGRAASRGSLAEGDRVYGRVVETRRRRASLGLVGRRAGGRRGGWRSGPAEDAAAAIDAAEELLAREGFSFRDVARTWFYLRDILDWYGPFNAVRNAAFRRMGLVGPGGDGQIPASTGIEGRNAARRLVHARPAGAAADAAAAARDASGCTTGGRTRRREYGSAFARAMEVVLGDARYVFVSGTASIDDHGATVHVGDFETQTRYTLEAVQALLEGAGARLADVAPGDGLPREPLRRARLRAHRRAVGPATASRSSRPSPTCAATTCSFEIDATAVVPLAPRGAAVTGGGSRAGASPCVAGAAAATPASARRRGRAARPPARADGRRAGPGRGRCRRRRSPAGRCARGVGEGGRLVLRRRRAGSRACSPPPSQRRRPRGVVRRRSRSCSRRRRRPPTPGASSR